MPLGCAWRLPVSGEPWLTKVIGGQSQVALPGRTVPGAVVFTGGETYLTTTQPGDALSLEYGNPVSNVTHPDGSQTLTFSTQEDLARVRIQLGDAPLPRVLGLSNETYTTTVAIGPPEVEFLAHAEDAWKPVSALPVVSDEDVTGTGVVPEDARFRVRVKAPVGTGSLGPAVLRARNTVGDAIDAGGLLPANNAEIALAPAGVTDRCQLFESAALIALPEPVLWFPPIETEGTTASGVETMEDSSGDPIPPEPFPVPADAVLVGNQCSVEVDLQGTPVTGGVEVMCDILTKPDQFRMRLDRNVNNAVNLYAGENAELQIEIRPPIMWTGPASVVLNVDRVDRAGTIIDRTTDTAYPAPPPYQIQAHEVGQTLFNLYYIPRPFIETPKVGYESLTLSSMEHVPNSRYISPRTIIFHVTGPQRVVKLRLVASSALVLTNDQIAAILGTLSTINTIYKQAGIRFELNGLTLERHNGIGPEYRNLDIVNVAKFQKAARETYCATLFIVSLAEGDDRLEKNGMAISIGEERAGFAVIDYDRVVPLNSGIIGETMAHELGHVIAALCDFKTGRTDRLMYNQGRTLDRLSEEEVYWLRHPPKDGVDYAPPGNKSRFFIK